MIASQIKNVLFIEDDNFYSKKYSKIIEKYLDQESDICQFKVVNKRTLSEAIDYLYQYKDDIDVILLDLNLPDSNGYETFQQVYDIIKTVPIIVITVLDDTDLAHRCVRDGAQDYLVKKESFTPEEIIIKTIQHSIYRKKIVEELFEYKNNLRRMVEKKTKELELAHKILSEVNKAQCWMLRNDVLEGEIEYLVTKFGRDVLNLDRAYFLELVGIDELDNKSYCRYSCIAEWDNFSKNQKKCLKDFRVMCDQIDFNGKMFKKKEPFVVLTKDIEYSKIRELFESHHALSIALVPVFDTDGNHVGILGFEDCQEERIWSKNELNALVSLATLISVANEKMKQNMKILEMLDKALKEGEEVYKRIEKKLNESYS